MTCRPHGVSSVPDKGNAAAAPAVGRERLSLPSEDAMLGHRARICALQHLQKRWRVALKDLEAPLHAHKAIFVRSLAIFDILHY